MRTKVLRVVARKLALARRGYEVGGRDDVSQLGRRGVGSVHGWCVRVCWAVDEGGSGSEESERLRAGRELRGSSHGG